MRKGPLFVGAFTVALTVGAASPAAAQGDPVGGRGNHYFLAGASNITGVASVDFVYGDPGDVVYFGDFVDETGAFGGDGFDDAMVRRGNQFIIRSQGGRVFSFGDPGDVVLVGDWDGDGTDTLAVRRGNRYFVKDDIDTGVADYDFTYGDPGDTVLVGNWDGQIKYWDPENTNWTDTLIVRRGNRYFVSNENSTGVADYEFTFGNPDDVVLVGDWATGRWGTGQYDSDGADQLAVRRGNVYFESGEVMYAILNGNQSGSALEARRSYSYGDVTDTAFTAKLPWYDPAASSTILGDALAVRR